MGALFKKGDRWLRERIYLWGKVEDNSWTHDSGLGGQGGKGRTLKATHGNLNQILLERRDQVDIYDD